MERVIGVLRAGDPGLWGPETGGLIARASTLAILGVLVYTCWGGRRVSAPAQASYAPPGRQAAASGREPGMPSGVNKIEAPQASFSAVACQLVARRRGLHRYVSSVTQPHEDEQRQISRELHPLVREDMLRRRV